MNFGEMRTQVRLLLGETDSSNSYYTDTEIDAQINLSNLRVASEVPVLFTYKEEISVGDQVSYGLPTDCMQVKDLQVYTTGTTRRWSLVKKDYDDWEYIVAGNFSMTGEPHYYKVEFGATSTTAGSPPGDVWLYPIPPGTTYTIRIVYYQKPTALSADAAVSELPEYLHPAVVYHAAWHIGLKDSSNSKVSTLAAMYQNQIKEGKMTALKSDRSGPTFAKSAYGATSLDRGRGNRRVRRGRLK